MKVYGLPIHDNWWQTETGMQLIANLPCLPVKPGSMGKPLPGVYAAVVDDSGQQLRAGQLGRLVPAFRQYHFFIGHSIRGAWFG